MIYMYVQESHLQIKVKNSEEEIIKEKDTRIVVYETTILKNLGYIFQLPC